MYERELIRLAPTEKKIAAILVDCAKTNVQSVIARWQNESA